MRTLLCLLRAAAEHGMTADEFLFDKKPAEHHVDPDLLQTLQEISNQLTQAICLRDGSATALDLAKDLARNALIVLNNSEGKAG